VPVVVEEFSTPQARKQFAEGSNRFAFELYGRESAKATWSFRR
jgi:hypothetical protein